MVELEKGIQGLVVMSTTLEEIFNCIHDARVPPLWERVRYPPPAQAPGFSPILGGQGGLGVRAGAGQLQSLDTWVLFLLRPGLWAALELPAGMTGVGGGRGPTYPFPLLFPPCPQAYPSLKPLGSWTRDLGQRVEQLARWAETAHPPVLFWLGGFTFPTGFLTAVLQGAARQSKVR